MNGVKPKDYEPYGPEWEKAMMKLPKKQLVAWLKKAFQENNILHSMKHQKYN